MYVSCENRLAYNILFTDSVQCKEFDDESDIGQLGILQEKLRNLDEENFEFTKNWIIKSIFVQSDEGAHDLIYTFFYLVGLKDTENKSKLFSRMLTSLHNLKDEFKCFEQIPRQAEEILVVTNNFNITEFVTQLINNKIINSSNFEAIKQRKRYNYSMNDDNIVWINSQKITTFKLKDDRFKLGSFIKNDDLEGMLEHISNYNNFNYNAHFNFKTTDEKLVLKLNLLDYAAFHGSINCFKHFILQSCYLKSENIAKYAFFGGNIEIIRILEQMNVDLTMDINVLNACFHNDVLTWIVDTRQLDLNRVHYSENVHFFKIMEQNNTPLRISFLATQSIIISKYLLYCFNSKKVNGIAFYNACYTGNIGLVKYLYQNYNIRIEKRRSGLNAFHVALRENRLEVVKYLLTIPGINYEHEKIKSLSVAMDIRDIQMIKSLVNESKGIEFDKNAWKESIDSDEPEILEIFMRENWTRKKFDLKESIERCIQMKCINNFKFFFQIDGSFDYCAAVINDTKLYNYEFNDAVFQKVKQVGRENFSLFKSQEWESIEQFEEWAFISSMRFQIVGKKEVFLSSLLTSIIQMTENILIIALKKCINDPHGHYKIRKLCDLYPDFFKLDEKDVVKKMDREDITSLMIKSCKYDVLFLKKYQSILPDIINATKKRDELINLGLKNKEIMEILLTASNFNFGLNSTFPLEFIAYETDIFDMVINHPNADLNRTKCYNEAKISLLMLIVLKSDIKYFEIFLQKPNIDVNFASMIRKSPNDEMVACYPIIHFLIYCQKIDFLKLLLQYPTIDLEILAIGNVSPLALAKKVGNEKIISMLLCDSGFDNSEIVNLVQDMDELLFYLKMLTPKNSNR